MRNPEWTRETIVQVSAKLFNTKGFKATSLSDITGATGLTKGAIYRHFADKRDLEKQTFTFISEILKAEFSKVIRAERTAPAKMLAIATFFRSYIFRPVIEGGCPILNAGTETDDANPELLHLVKSLLDTLQASLVHLLKKGIEHGQIRADTDCDKFASLFIASLEGGVLLSKIRRSTKDITWVVEDLEKRITEISL